MDGSKGGRYHQKGHPSCRASLFVFIGVILELYVGSGKYNGNYIVKAKIRFSWSSFTKRFHLSTTTSKAPEHGNYHMMVHISSHVSFPSLLDDGTT